MVFEVLGLHGDRVWFLRFSVWGGGRIGYGFCGSQFGGG